VKKGRRNRTVSTSSSSNVSRIIDYIEQKRMQKKLMPYVGPCQNFTDVFGNEANNYKNENRGINNATRIAKFGRNFYR